MNDAVIIQVKRTAVGKAKKGALRNIRPDTLASQVILQLLKEVPALKAEEIGDVILGCAMPEGEQGLNIARIVALNAHLPIEVPGMTINRFCSSGLQSIALAADRICSGVDSAILAGGVESMSMVPMGGYKMAPNPDIVDSYPGIYISMGLTAERVAEKYKISRQAQDEFSLKSHQKASVALESGRFRTEICPIQIKEEKLLTKPKNKKWVETEFLTFQTDEGPRKETSLEALMKLKPAFKAEGTVTAGNSSQMSDGAACALVMSASRAQELGLKPMARFVTYAVAGVEPELMGMGPVKAIAKALKQAGLTLSQIGLIELNEAFAAQALAVIQEIQIDPQKVNVNGGAIALGHPLGCTGAKLTATLLNEMKARQIQFGMVTMCVGGGMGAAGIFELVA
ncbi:MAG: acetyl-CoA C-acyltransferase [Planctomycetota bacterium]